MMTKLLPLKILFFISIVSLGTNLIYNQDTYASPDDGNSVGEAVDQEANELLRAAGALNVSNITYADTSELSNDLEDNSGVGYYDPPYSYAQCLTVFTKEMCDFRFNGN